MPIIKSKNVDTVKVDGKIFALECDCNTKDRYRFGREFICFGDGSPNYFGVSKYRYNNHPCDTCDKYPSIILPR